MRYFDTQIKPLAIEDEFDMKAVQRLKNVGAVAELIGSLVK